MKKPVQRSGADAAGGSPFEKLVVRMLSPARAQKGEKAVSRPTRPAASVAKPASAITQPPRAVAAKGAAAPKAKTVAKTAKKSGATGTFAHLTLGNADTARNAPIMPRRFADKFAAASAKAATPAEPPMPSPGSFGDRVMAAREKATAQPKATGLAARIAAVRKKLGID